MARFEAMRVGAEQRTVIVIDDFCADPDRLREAATAATFVPGLHAYPGIRAALPAAYWRDQQPLVTASAAMLGLVADEATLIDASFSIVTTPRPALSLAQRMPHCDAHEAGRVAFVHYLGPGEASGGTAFFRHRSTGFETVDRHLAPIFDGQLDAELRYGAAPPADYVGDDDRLFERIAVVPARYNRAVVYHSMALHSGVIPADATLSADPADGRLTVTGFVAFAR